MRHHQPVPGTHPRPRTAQGPQRGPAALAGRALCGNLALAMILTGTGAFVHPVLPQPLWYLPWTSLPPLLALWASCAPERKKQPRPDHTALTPTRNSVSTKPPDTPGQPLPKEAEMKVPGRPRAFEHGASGFLLKADAPGNG